VIGPTGAEIHRLKYVEKLKWREIKALHPEVPLETMRGRCRSFANRQEQEPKQQKNETAESTFFEEFRNTASAETKSTRIKTLEQLLEACEVDLDVWRVDHHVLNKWETGMKIGPKGAETVVVEPLFQVKAWLVRIEPDLVFPTLQPVHCDSVFRVSPLSEPLGMGRSLVFADPQIGFRRDMRSGALDPFHDRRVLDVILQIAAVARPTRIDIAGDLLDLPDWTDRFLRSPEFYWSTQPAVLEGHWWLAQFRQAAPDAQITIYEGNHERRMDDAIVKHLIAAYDLRAADEIALPPAMSVPRLLALHEMDIEWIDDYPRGRDYLNPRVKILHGEIARQTGNTAKKVAQDADGVEIFGHVHRLEWVSWTRYLRDENQISVGFCPGCACRIDGEVPGWTPQRRWQNGCAVIDFETEGQHGYNIDPILIEDGRALWNGHMFEGRDRVDDLRRDIPDWNW